MSFGHGLRYAVRTYDHNTILTELLKYKETIENTLYRVRIPIIATYSVAEIRYGGIPIDSTTNQKTDPTVQTTVVYKPLREIISIWKDGHPVELDEGSVLAITDHLRLYLTTWVRIIQQTPVQPNLNYDDLITLSEFYEHLKPYRPTTPSSEKKNVNNVLLAFVLSEMKPTDYEEEDSFSFSMFFQRGSV